MKLFKKTVTTLLATIMLLTALVPICAGAVSSSQIYYNIDMSAAVLASRIQQQVSSDCAVVSMATIESYLYGAKSNADRTKVYNELVSKNKDDNYAYWSNCGYIAADIDWKAVYNQLAKGYPVIVHRPATSTKSQHWAVVAGYKGSTTSLQKDQFIIVDVYHGTGGTDIYTSATWRGSTSIDRMAYRKNGIAITSLSGIKFAIDHPVLVHQKGTGHGVYGYITSNQILTSIQFRVTNVKTGVDVYNKTVTPNSNSYLIYNLDSEFTFAKWAEGEYYFSIFARTASSRSTYNKYFQIASGWPTAAPTLKYTINFDSNGGTGTIASNTINYDGRINIPSTEPTRSGYTFLGWNVTRDGDGKSYCDNDGWYTDSEISTSGYSRKLYKPGESYTHTYIWINGAVTNRSYTFSAVWQANSTTNYTVSYNANGGSGAPASQTKVAGATLTLSSVVPSRTGYVFLGWSANSGATSATYNPGSSYTADSSVTLYAVWQKGCAQHSYVSSVTAPTCATQGYTTHTCSVCGDNYKDTYTNATGHTYSNGICVQCGASDPNYVIDQSATQVIVQSVTAGASSTVQVNVSLKNNPGIWGMDIMINYDKSKMTLTNVINGAVFSSSEWTPGNMDADKYILSYEAGGFDNITTDGVLATLEFTVNEDVESGEFLAVYVSYNSGDIISVDFTDINATMVSGGVKVADCLYGDLNGDGLVNKKDSLLMKMYLADNSTVIDKQAADVYFDGSINKKDSLYLKQYLAGADIKLGA